MLGMQTHNVHFYIQIGDVNSRAVYIYPSIIYYTLACKASMFHYQERGRARNEAETF